jgi:hypothetical protein
MTLAETLASRGLVLPAPFKAWSFRSCPSA